MVDILDVANYFLSKESMTHKKVQKLCYYAQAWYFYFFKEKLADTEFEAWIHGPVSPKLYVKLKENGFSDIQKINTPPVLDENIVNVLEAVFKAYGDFSGDQLESLSHSESPWILARDGIPPYEPSHNIISLESMYEFCEKTMNERQPNV